jgi:protein TonB
LSGTQRVKLTFQNPGLSIAVAVSLLLHCALLAVRFAAPESFRFKPEDPGLEVILVNAKHDKKPLKADALAQANLDGGGNAEAGRAKSPLPDLRKTEDGDSIKETKRRIAELEELQQKMLAQAIKKTPFSTPRVTDRAKPKEAPQPEGTDQQESAKVLARSVAEISRNIEDYNKRPKKTQITPSTQEVRYAMYYNSLREKIQKFGTLNFPRQDGKQLYGELLIYLPVYQDGSIYQREGGMRVERSSGVLNLDRAALRIIERSAPFSRFPENMRSKDKDDVWEIILRLKFTREETLEAELRGGNS